MTDKKKWLPILGLAALTISLIFIFKDKENLREFVKDQKSNLAEFYSQNLKPLFIQNPITREDVLNFALYGELPLDKDNNQYLYVSEGSEDNDYFEFKYSSEVPQKNNLEKFSESLNLTSREKVQMDSILDSYAAELRTKILVSDKNAIAINSNLWNLKQAISADILSFAAHADNQRFTMAFPEQPDFYNDPGLGKMISDVKTSGDSNFIFITPDTIFTKVHKIDKALVTHEMAEAMKDLETVNNEMKVKIKFNKELVTTQKNRIQNYKIHLDSNMFRIQIPKIEIPELPEMDKLNADIEEATKHLKDFTFSFELPSPAKNKMNLKFHIGHENKDSIKNFELNIDLPNIDSIVTSNLEGMNIIDPEYWEEFGRKMDSLGRKMEDLNMDSNFNNEEFKEEIKEFRREIEKSNTQVKKENYRN